MKSSNAKQQLICELLKPLAYGGRLEVLSTLKNTYQSINEVSGKSNQCLSTVSGHLRTLHKNGFVKRKMKKTSYFFSLTSLRIRIKLSLSYCFYK